MWLVVSVADLCVGICSTRGLFLIQEYSANMLELFNDWYTNLTELFRNDLKWRIGIRRIQPPHPHVWLDLTKVYCESYRIDYQETFALVENMAWDSSHDIMCNKYCMGTSTVVWKKYTLTWTSKKRCTWTFHKIFGFFASATFGKVCKFMNTIYGH